LDNLSESVVAELNIPTAAPLVYELDDNLKPIPHKDAIAPLSGHYLGNQEEIRARILGVKVTEQSTMSRYLVAIAWLEAPSISAVLCSSILLQVFTYSEDFVVFFVAFPFSESNQVSVGGNT